MFMSNNIRHSCILTQNLDKLLVIFYFNISENKFKTIQQLIGEIKEEARQWDMASGGRFLLTEL